MPTGEYSLTRFWRYIFTPLLLLLFAFIWVVVFSFPLGSAPIVAVVAPAVAAAPVLP